MDPYRQSMLTYCRRLAEQADPIYAEWAAGWYEANEPVRLQNLQAKVRQELRRVPREALPPEASRAE